MNSIKTRYPYLVKIEDKLLSQNEIDDYKLEAKQIREEKESVSQKIRLANAFGSFTFLVFLLTLIGMLISYLTSQGDWVELGFFLIAELIVIFALGFQQTMLKEKEADLDWVDESELNLIESDPAACENLEKWVREYEYVKSYAEKIAELGRLPTFAEFHCVEYWVKQKERNKPVESLKAAMNIQQAQQSHSVALQMTKTQED